ncbi:hypothetical protein BP6252_00410 [Coleophoma cylindrospora]|uniref:Rhodopsin domain-containing protein n=1 Tax=Coleophoma cylindrospora TaxID=1849047 RepID=A0A3D8SRF4_9HELO|nr:hypothetical protein BP6252_00410 [Coleophoma cylindrospora]
MGWTYNTVNPDAPTDAPKIVAVGVTFSVVSLIIVSLRLYVRVFMIKATGIDDWAIVATWFCALGFSIVTYLQTKWGLGLQHLSDMPNENYFNFGLLQYAGAPLYIASILGFKLSLLFSFLRIAVERSHRTAILILLVACTAFNFSFLMVQINLCQPISKQEAQLEWDPAVTGGSCLDSVPVYTIMASITIIFDVLIMLTPFPMLLKAQIQKQKKAILLGIFSLGIFITVIQIIRILTIKSLANAIDSSQLIMWSMVENNLGIIVASIPPLSPLIRSVREKTSSSGRTKNKSTPRGMSYAMQSMRTGNRDRDGHVVLGSGHDTMDGKDSNTVVVSGNLDNSSEEFIFPNSNHRIHQKTEVLITRDH